MRRNHSHTLRDGAKSTRPVAPHMRDRHAAGGEMDARTHIVSGVLSSFRSRPTLYTPWSGPSTSPRVSSTQSRG